MQAEGREISFNLEDYRHSEYVGPSKAATFTGAGQKLGRFEIVLTDYFFTVVYKCFFFPR